MWLMILSMTTVGYGDIYPRTNLGRLFTMLACFAGTFVVSLLTVTITTKISMNDQESNAYEYITNL
jgi:voltage-gated potassium channel